MKTWMKKQMSNNEGFTLAELLIVVAIIAILVAVSIPIFTSKLEKSREATDLSNMRSAKAAAVTAYLAGDKIGSGKCGKEDVTAYYNADDGKLVAAKTDAGEAYGQGTADEGDSGNKTSYYKPTDDAAGKIIEVTIGKTGTISMSWVAK